VTPDRNEEAPDENVEHGVLDDIGTLDTASIGILGGQTAQVSVSLPPSSDDDDVDDDVIEDELPIDAGLAELPPAEATPAPAQAEPVVDEIAARDIVLEPHDADEPAAADGDDVHDAEIVEEARADAAEAEVAETTAPYETAPDAGDADAADADVLDADPADDAATDESPADGGAADEGPTDEGAADEAADTEPVAEAESVDAAADVASDRVAEAALDAHRFESAGTDPAPGARPAPGADRPTDVDPLSAASEPGDPTASPSASSPVERASSDEAPVSAPAEAVAHADAEATGAAPTRRSERAVTGVIGTIPLTRREAHHPDEAARADRVHAAERVKTPASGIALTSKRLGEIDDKRETSDLLTADRLLDPRQISRPEPEGLWQQLVYSVSRRRINLGDGRRARERKALDRRIAAPLPGGARFVPVLSRKGGVGKTTVTSLLGMALADARDDRVIAVDANPDRGTLADRVGRPNGRTVRDLVRGRDDVSGYNDISSIVARDATRLDVLASDADPRVSEAFSDDDYREVAQVAAHYYSIVLTDTGTGIVHSVMGATLAQADTLVIVAGLSVDEARLASETLTWLETNGYAARVRDAVVVLNNARPGTPLVRESELESHFRTRVRSVIRMPYDPLIAAGSAISFRDLHPGTRLAARELAAAVVEGLRTSVVAA